MKKYYRIVEMIEGVEQTIAEKIAELGTAHSFAEIYSYTKHRNAIYGLFKIRIEEY